MQEMIAYGGYEGKRYKVIYITSIAERIGFQDYVLDTKSNNFIFGPTNKVACEEVANELNRQSFWITALKEYQVMNKLMIRYRDGSVHRVEVMERIYKKGHSWKLHVLALD